MPYAGKTAEAVSGLERRDPLEMHRFSRMMLQATIAYLYYWSPRYMSFASANVSVIA